jgi:pimeloyl-ACP methyl ester carboxylesterase
MFLAIQPNGRPARQSAARLCVARSSRRWRGASRPRGAVAREPDDSRPYSGTVVTETNVNLADRSSLHVYDTGAGDSGTEDLVVVWHHGSPNIGAPPRPLFPTSDELGIRWIGYDRPGYGASTPNPDRDIASAAHYSAAVADALGIDRFAAMGHSGGGAHALACAALLPERVLGVVSISTMAPYDAEGLDWFAGFAPAGAGSLRAATRGRAAREAHEADGDEEQDIGFTDADEAALGDTWSWFIDVVRPALEDGPAPMIDDNLAAVRPWGFDPAEVAARTLVVHGGRDRMVPSSHGEWLARRVPSAELWLRPDDGHITIMDAGADALRWLARP